jgi:hypothetical protein
MQSWFATEMDWMMKMMSNEHTIFLTVVSSTLSFSAHHYLYPES